MEPARTLCSRPALTFPTSYPYSFGFPTSLLPVSQFHHNTPFFFSGLPPWPPPCPVFPSECPLLGPCSWTSLSLRCITPKTFLLFSPSLTGLILNQQAISGEMGILGPGNVAPFMSECPYPRTAPLHTPDGLWPVAVWISHRQGSHLKVFLPQHSTTLEGSGKPVSVVENRKKFRRLAHPRRN